MRPSRAQIAPAIAVFVAVLLAAIAGYVIRASPGAEIAEPALPTPSTATPGPTVEYTVEEGASAGTIGADLEALGVIRSGRQFEFLVSLIGLEGGLAAGNYDLPSGISALDAVDRVTVRGGDVPVVRVTFPEGIRIEEMAERAEAGGFGTAESFLAAVDAATVPPLIAATLPEGQGLQGYLFPDTYIMPAGSTAAELIDFMLETFLGRVDATLLAGFQAQGLNLHQAVTLASIVEREAVLAEERPLIAGVFYNRLAAGDLLGADPTTQFAVALDPDSVEEYGWWKQELTEEDLADTSPYNTRENPGLPPGPITNPGLAALEAVAFPETTEFYYFVADAVAGDGSHVFAITFEEHERNIAEYGTPEAEAEDTE